MPEQDLGAAAPEELCDLLGGAYAVALLLPADDGTKAALWMREGVDPEYVSTWLHGEAHRLDAALTAPVAPVMPPGSDPAGGHPIDH